MAVDIATLGIKVDASEADKGAASLTKLAESGEKAERSTKSNTSATSAYNSTLKQLLGAIQQNTSALGAMATNASKAGTAQASAASSASDYADRVAQLRSSVDPLGIAQERVNQELAEASALYEAGAIDATRYAQAQQVLAARSGELINRQAALTTRLNATGIASKLSANEALNLSRQFADVGVTAAMGMNPLMIAIQQGPQIADIMKTSGLSMREMGVEMLKFFGILKEVPVASAAATAAHTAQATAATAAAGAEQRLAIANTEAAASATGVAVASGAATVALEAQAVAATTAGAATTLALAPVAAVVGAIVAVLATLTAGFAIYSREVSKSVGDVTKGMGLTEKQLERLKDKSIETTVTMGDTFGSFMEVTGSRLYDAFETPLNWLGEKFGAVYDYITETTDQFVGHTVGMFFGMYRGITTLFSNLPSAIGDVFIQMANIVLKTVQDLVNGVSDTINNLAKNLPFGLGAGINLGHMPAYQLENPNAGAAGGLRDKVNAADAAGYEEGQGAYKRFKDDVRSGAKRRATDRVREGAGDADKESGRKGGQSELEKATKASEDYIKSLKEETAEIGKNRIETKIMAVERKALLAPTDALAKATREAGEAWKQATFAEETRKLKRELGDLAEAEKFEITLQGMSIEQREIAIAQREHDIRLRGYERDGIKINTAEIAAETMAIMANAEARGALKQAAEDSRDAADHVGNMADRVRDASSAFGELFGSAGNAISGVVDALADYYQMQFENEAKLDEIRATSGENSQEYFRATREQQEQAATAELEMYGNLLGGMKSFFGQKSAMGKAMAAAEKLYAGIRLAMMIKELVLEKVLTTTKVAGAGTRMATDTAETASSVAKSGVRAAADGVAAFAKTLASLPFPFNLVAGAAVLAALVAVGVKISGGGGGKKSASATASEASQPKYNGPVDEYGAPTSGYSVLKPGRTTVAGSNDNSANLAAPAAAGGGVTVGDVNITVQGNTNDDTLEQIQQVLVEHRKETVQEARRAAARDMAVANGRQRTGG